MVLRAYFDASLRNDGTFSVAGYAFSKLRLKKFDQEWGPLFDPYGGSHHSELTSRNGRFEGISVKEKDRLVVNGVSIINRWISYGAAVSCNVQEISPLLPKFMDGFQHPYPVCCHFAMLLLGGLVSRSGNDEIAYFFESGDEHSGTAHRFMGHADGVPILRESYRHRSHSFVAKTEALALGAADLLAWEWTKYFDETVGTRRRPIRKSLIALLNKNGDVDQSRYAVAHLSGEPLRNAMKAIEKIGIAQSAEEIAAAASTVTPPSGVRT